MGLLEILKNILNIQKEIDTKILPSQGLFYKDDFKIFIKKADMEDIIEYEYNFSKDNIGLIIHKIKKVVEKNTILSNGYSYIDIKSIDIIFLFIEIVKLTKNEPIKLTYYDELIGMNRTVEFSSKYFNYFKINDKIMNNYNKELKCFEIDGYKYTLPAIGIENSISNFLIDRSNKPTSYKYNQFNYDFTYFLLNKNKLEFNEIENLIQIFNFDLDNNEVSKIRDIVNIFLPLQQYSLIENGRIIDINAKINLEKIWK